MSNCFYIGHLYHKTDLFTYPPFNTTTLIKPMNKEEEEEAPLEGSRVLWNCLAQERHAARFEE
jgi:hypothetical protein